MGKPKKTQNLQRPVVETGSSSSSQQPPSEARKTGRRLTLEFTDEDVPILQRIEFTPRAGADPEFLEQNRPLRGMQWSAVPKAISLVLLGYLAWNKAGRTGTYSLTGKYRKSLVASLGDALDKDGPFQELFTEVLPSGKSEPRAKVIFQGPNLHGKAKDKRDRHVSINQHYLPPDCVEIFWNCRGTDPLQELEDIEELARRIRKSQGIPDEPAAIPEEEVEPPPPPVEKPAPPVQELSRSRAPRPKTATELFAEPPGEAAPAQQPELPKAEPQVPAGPVPAPPAEAFSLGQWLAKEFGLALKSLREEAPASRPIEEQPQPKPAPAREHSPKIDAGGGEFAFELKSASEPEKEEPEEEDEESTLEPSPPPIDPRFFEIHNPDRLEWDDSDGLINFSGDESEADLWRIRDASEGLLIFGSVGSGKTSGSGSAFARAFLQAGFGGLVMTAKPDEARRWLRMCQETGRAADYVHVTPGSDHKLSFLQYESQRPGNRIAVTDDLIALFRCLIGVMSRSKRSEVGDDFWTATTNQLMRKLMDIFLLAGEPLTLDRMVQFISVAPTDARTDWRRIKMFASVITRAEKAALQGTDEDKRIHKDTFNYWTEVYPKITDVTRSGFITAFSAMADTLSGRGIYEMIGTETNLTPEMILSGKVVILDIPLKGNIQGGLMVQAMWKLLFQQAVERRADKGLKTARPAFLWEDEGHEFFSQNDVRFQPSARDCRAPHVIISQNLHNFFHLGHHEHAVKAVFAAMNTYIFHTNGDLDTNRWASERIGGIKKLKLTTEGLLKPLKNKDISFYERRPEEVENVGRMKIAEESKPAMLPEDFMKLKRGGDGTCEAVILWLAHKFPANQNRNFCVLTFEQEPRTT